MLYSIPLRSRIPFFEWLTHWVRSQSGTFKTKTDKYSRLSGNEDNPTAQVPLLPDDFDLQAGVEDAFNKYYLTYRSIFYLFTFKLVQNKEIAKDIVSDTYANCWELRSRFRTMKDVHSYLYVSCRNRAYDYLKYGRGFKNKKEILADPRSGEFEDPDESSFINDIIRSEHFLEIYQSVEKLSPQRRQVIKLHYMDGYSLDDIAGILGMSYALVKTVKSQALAQLRTFFKS